MKVPIYLSLVVLLASCFMFMRGSAAPVMTADDDAMVVAPISDDAMVVAPIPSQDARPEHETQSSSSPLTPLRLRACTNKPLRQGITAGIHVTNVVKSRHRERKLGQAWDSFSSRPVLLIIVVLIGLVVACIAIVFCVIILPFLLFRWLAEWCQSNKEAPKGETNPTDGVNNTADDASDASSIATTDSMETDIDYSGKKIRIDMTIFRLAEV